MNRLGSSRGLWSVVVLLVLGGLAPSTTEAQDWHEFYADGLTALQNGQGQRAVELLERAIEGRSQPGMLVPTYGTNFVPQYFPYLRSDRYASQRSSRSSNRVSSRHGRPARRRRAPVARSGAARRQSAAAWSRRARPGV